MRRFTPRAVLSGSPSGLFKPTRLDLARDGQALETVQLVKVVFKLRLQAEFGCAQLQPRPRRQHPPDAPRSVTTAALTL